jgi:hypothetical protein
MEGLVKSLSFHRYEAAAGWPLAQVTANHRIDLYIIEKGRGDT